MKVTCSPHASSRRACSCKRTDERSIRSVRCRDVRKQNHVVFEHDQQIGNLFTDYPFSVGLRFVSDDIRIAPQGEERLTGKFRKRAFGTRGPGRWTWPNGILEEFHPPLKFAYITGWRFKSEVLPLTVAQVDLKAGFVRLEVGTTKSGEGRSFYVTTELRKVLKAQLASIEALKKRGTLCPYIFHREDGSPILDYKKLWRKACEDAGHPGKLFHDFRRTAVRNLERAAVPRSTAMAMVGHKTESIYRRYAIVDEAMHREAAAKLDVWAAEEKAKAAAERRGQIKRFKNQVVG